MNDLVKSNYEEDKMPQRHISIGIFWGSLRRDSYSRRIALTAESMLPEDFEARFIDLSGLSFYNEDHESRPPAEWVSFRETVKSLSGFLFVTPEYNRSITPVLKNALDIASRPYGQNCWSGKPGAVISVSPGQMGAMGANLHLRQVLACLNVFTLAQPEAYIGNAASLFNSGNEMTSDSARDFLRMFTDSFASWVRRFAE